MTNSEKFLDLMYCRLSSLGLQLDKEVVREHLLKPGEGRLQLIRWALSEMNIVAKENDIVNIVIDCGLCLPSDRNIVLGNCPPEDSFEFWKRLFHMVKVYQEIKPSSPNSTHRNIFKFWVELTSKPELKDVLQPKKRENLLPLNLQHKHNVTKNVSLHELEREKLVEENKLKELEKEKEMCKIADNTNEHCSSEIKDIEAFEKLKGQVSLFKNDVYNYLMPWISDKPQSPQQNKFDELVPVLAKKVETLKSVYQNAEKILAALETISNIKLEEPYIDETLDFPHSWK